MTGRLMMHRQRPARLIPADRDPRRWVRTAHPADWPDRPAELRAETSEPKDQAAGPSSTGEGTDEGHVEGVLLIAKSPMSLRRLAALAGLPDATRARTIVRSLNETYRRDGRGLTIEMVAGGARLMSHPSVAPWLGRLGYLPATTKLSTPMIETLAVVAYREPVTRAEVESVRGLACGEVLKQLLGTELIRIAGRSEELGRPYQYATTTKFLKIFGLPSLSGLPPIDAPTPLGDSSGGTPSPSNPAPSSAPSGSPELPMPTLLDPPTILASIPIAAGRGRQGNPVTRDRDDVAATANTPAAVIEDEEDDLYEKGPEVDDEDDDDVEDDWDDDEEDDEVEDDAEEDEDDEEDEDEGWQEVSDDDSEEDWGDDDEEEEDDDDWDDAAEDDEDWTE